MGNTHLKITHYRDYTLKTRPTTLELPPGNALTAKCILQLVRVASTP